MNDAGEADPILATRDTFSEARSISNETSSSLNSRTSTIAGRAVKGGFLGGGSVGIVGGCFLGGIGFLCEIGGDDNGAVTLVILGSGFFLCGVISIFMGIVMPKNLRC
jgi:hypothetical protein